jgi:putative transposase
MPRHARIALPGIPWHIIKRGNNRSACFYAEEDYRRYRDTLSAMPSRYDCQIHAYVLMTNHVQDQPYAQVAGDEGQAAWPARSNSDWD